MILQGDNLENLKKLEDNSVDAVVTDPPYGLSFMNKKWDYDVPSVEFWQEVYRVLKPGGHVLSFGGTRTYHRMVVNIEDAGFDIRDQIQWIYGSGFPKSHNIGKAVDKLEGNEREVVGVLENYQNKNGVNAVFSTEKVIDENRDRVDIPLTKGNSQYEGWGTALKPANEPICVARKPLSEKSVAENVLKWGTGGINIDGCRVSHNEPIRPMKAQEGGNKVYGQAGRKEDTTELKEEGRFPANIILECICDEVIKGEKGEVKKSNNDKMWNSDLFGQRKEGDHYTDKGDIHTNPMCPCYLLDEQSGVSKSSKITQPLKDIRGGSLHANSEKGNRDIITERGHNDKGGASRFFYQAKVSKKERNLGLDGFEEKEFYRLDPNQNTPYTEIQKKYAERKPRANTHPTVKPITLMSYLCRLITPEGGVVLDPFMGSGSTGIAARLEGFDFIGMEMDEDYVKIAEARIENFEKYREFLNKK
jgi:site-specific DNA-methyltransferase (adenine-specific)